MPASLPFRVFLSSPGDVTGERARALELLHALPRRPAFKGRVTIEVSAWDDPLAVTPMDATRTPQLSVIEHNERPSLCDLTIVILWGRLGTRLPARIAKPDGAAYRSGTEWELEDARAANKPIWLFRRTGYAPSLDDPEYEQKVDQYRTLKQFFADLKDDRGALVGGWTEYDSEETFATKLSQQLERELRKRIDAMPREDDRFRVFIARAADELDRWRGQLEAQIASVPGFVVVDGVPPPYEAEAHEAATSVLAKDADLCIHLLGTLPGAPLDNDAKLNGALDATAVSEVAEDLTYPMEQLRVCLSSARSQLILHPDGFRIDRVTHGRYRSLLERTHADERVRTRLEVIASVPTKGTRARDLVLEKYRQIQQDRRAAVANEAADTAEVAAFVDVHPYDQEPTQSLIGYLDQRVRMLRIGSSAHELPAAPEEVFEDLVSKARYVIVVFGKVASQWVLKRLEEAVKIALDRRTGLRCGIYLRPGAPQWDAPLPGYSQLIDNSGGFDPSPIDSFLNPGARS